MTNPQAEDMQYILDGMPAKTYTVLHVRVYTCMHTAPLGVGSLQQRQVHAGDEAGRNPHQWPSCHSAAQEHDDKA